MARTFISQPSQIFNTENYDDTLVAGSTLQTTASNLEADLNAIRSQIRRVLWAGVTGSWYDTISSPSGSNSARGLNTINVDLSDLEQKRFLFRRQNLNLVNVATGSNFVLLSNSLGTAPADFAVVSHPLLLATTLTGTLVAALSGSEGVFGSHSVALMSGASALTPKNLVIVRDAWTGLHLTSSAGRDVYGLLQVESGTLTGQAFNDSTRRTQISFVKEVTLNGTSSFAATAVTDVGGRTMMYSYVRRTALDDIPEDAYLSNTVFLDRAETSSGNSSSSVALSDITLDRAIDNQVGTVTMDQNIAIRIAGGFAWTFMSGTKELWKLASSDSGDTLTTAVDRISFSSSFPTTFQEGISVATGSTRIDVGNIAGTVNTLTGANLILKGGNQTNFSDFFGDTSTYLGGAIPFATATLEWNNFATGFGNQTSILGALHVISQSLSSSLRRIRASAGLTPLITSAHTNITFPTNLDAPLLGYTGRDFVKDLNVFLNGILLLPGRSVSDPNDVYPGTTVSTGDLKFSMTLRTGSIISMERF